jgi:hypothetical protein
MGMEEGAFGNSHVYMQRCRKASYQPMGVTGFLCHLMSAASLSFLKKKLESNHST